MTDPITTAVNAERARILSLLQSYEASCEDLRRVMVRTGHGNPVKIDAQLDMLRLLVAVIEQK